ncbi:MAG: VWA domain-containing protein [Planctomycetes bacterium]|nr:VWA domain-containing protein [Planctomycetota bacterium]
MNLGDVFAWPAGLPILLLVPVAWFFLRTFDRLRARRLARLVGPRVGVLASGFSVQQRHMRRWLLVAALALALLAILQPLGGESIHGVERRGVDILVCLDVSRSMLARDLIPSRLERARREIRALADGVRGDRLGLVAFAGTSRLMAPLTRDAGSFTEIMELADPLSVGRGGTDLGAALETALAALGDADGDHEVILLLTDGEDLQGRGRRVAEVCRSRGIAVHCIGFGSGRGGKIPVEEDGVETFLKDGAGNEVVSIMDASSLRKVAETTGGVFVNAAGKERPLGELYERRILPMAKKAFDTGDTDSRGSRFQWPLLVAYLIWVLELCLTDRRRR